jgi:hypothetical protein
MRDLYGWLIPVLMAISPKTFRRRNNRKKSRLLSQVEVELNVSSFWDKQIERADELAAQASGSKELLTFYAQLLRAQKTFTKRFVRAHTGCRREIWKLT